MPRTLRLPCKLTDVEKLVVSGDLSAALTALEAAEALKKLKMKEHNDVIKEHKTTVHTLNVSLSTGTVEREVPVEDRPDPITGKLICFRLDTNEPVNTRPLDPEERQLLLGDAPGPAPAETIGDDSARTEEQNAAATPDEAEALREARLLEEQSKRAFEGIGVGDDVELLTELGWTTHKVEEKNEFDFAVGPLLYDVSRFGVTWRLPLSWDEVKAASAEKERLAEIAKLEAEQAADKPKALLKAPKKPRRLNVVDKDEKPIEVPAETPPPSPLGEDDIAF